MTTRSVQMPLGPEHCHCDEGCGAPEKCHDEGYGIEPYCLCSEE